MTFCPSIDLGLTDTLAGEQRYKQVQSLSHPLGIIGIGVVPCIMQKVDQQAVAAMGLIPVVKTKSEIVRECKSLAVNEMLFLSRKDAVQKYGKSDKWAGPKQSLTSKSVERAGYGYDVRTFQQGWLITRTK